MSPRPREPAWLPRSALVVAQTDQIREHGGPLGLRDEERLESALARPRHRWTYDEDCDLADLAASYGFGIVRNHPFVDGYKRAGFIAMNVFLILNGHEIEAPEPALVDAMRRLADGSLDEAGLAAWIRSVLVPYQG